MFTKTSFVLTGLPSALWIWTDPKRDWRLLSLRGVLFLHPPYPAKFKTSPSLPSITEPQSWKLRRSSISGLLHCMSQTTELSKTLRSADNISSQGLIFFFFFFFQGFSSPDFHEIGWVTFEGLPVKSENTKAPSGGSLLLETAEHLWTGSALVGKCQASHCFYYLCNSKRYAFALCVLWGNTFLHVSSWKVGAETATKMFQEGVTRR